MSIEEIVRERESFVSLLLTIRTKKNHQPKTTAEGIIKNQQKGLTTTVLCLYDYGEMVYPQRCRST